MSEGKRLLITQHFSYGISVANKYEEVLFAPQYYSSIQKEFYQKLFREYRELTSLEWCEEIETLENVDVLAWDAHVESKIYGDSLLPHQNRLFDELEFNFTDSFSNFRKKAEKYLPDYFDLAIAPQIPSVKNEIEYYFWEKKLASSYFKTRNGMLGRDYSTKFSCLLSSGSLDVRYLYNTVQDFQKQFGKNKSTEWIIFELLWREFFYWHYQKWKRAYFSSNGIKGPLAFHSFPDYSFEELKVMKAHPFFFSALRELEQTGFMSNRGRQIFASIWLNDLGLDWRSGAFLFERTLIDYDVYSNYGNWMYLAGVGVDPWGRRYFNVEKQLDQYDPNHDYLTFWS